jgi:hypothetical protein
MSKLVLGIDPGQNGSVALMGLNNEIEIELLEYDKMTPHDLANRLDTLKGLIRIAYIEAVHSMPAQGVASSFKFGRNFGFYLGVLIALKIPFKYVLPRAWQKHHRCLSKGDKNVTKRKAQELFPWLSITHSTADALLIAEYGRHTENQL